jgi:hypothetical protein
VKHAARATFAVAALALLTACGDSKPQDAAPAPVTATNEAAPAVDPVTPTDYSAPAAWLCRPGAEDACRQMATSTSVSADGRLAKDGFAPASDPPIDCFYVYPTISHDLTANSDIVPGAEEQEIARQQFARFGAVCRLYASMYRQVTLSALRQMLAGKPTSSDREMAYADVKAAWEHYLAADNGGRGVVLIGHSQGAGLLSRLIAAEIDGKPTEERLVSALLIGTTIEVKPPTSVGGTFGHVPLCATADSAACVIAYSSFRADAPPPADSLFGVASTEGLRAACVNPAELDGSAGQLKAILPARSAGLIDEAAQPAPWTSDSPAIDTPFVSVPGLLSAACVEQGGFSYLGVTVNADPLDKRTDSIAGDVVVGGKVQPQWGLHLIDMHLAMGNLVGIVKRQGAEWLRLQSAAASLPPEFHKDQ